MMKNMLYARPSPVPQATAWPRLPVLAVLLAGLCGCERQIERADYFPLRDGNYWEYRLLDQPRLKAISEGKVVETSKTETADAHSNQGAGDIMKSEELLASTGGAAPPRPDAAQATHSATQPSGNNEPPLPGQPGLELPSTPGTGSTEARPSEKSSGLPPARRVRLELKEGVDELTYRAMYDGSEQVWSKRGGYVGLQNSHGRQYLLILPPHTNARWIVTDGTENLYFEVEPMQDVETPAGRFTGCAVARQESRDKQMVFKYWFAPEVGMVRRSKLYKGVEVFRQELLEYKVKPSSFETRAAENNEIRAALNGKNRGDEHRERPRNGPPVYGKE